MLKNESLFEQLSSKFTKSAAMNPNFFYCKIQYWYNKSRKLFIRVLKNASQKLKSK